MDPAWRPRRRRYGRSAVTNDQTYAYANAIPEQGERLRTLEALLDAGTIRQLECVRPGWHCLEVGAGGGSIARWLCDRTGPQGSVLATDLDITHLRGRSRPNLEVRVHDVLADDLPHGRFDLIHLRLVLGWLADPVGGLRRLYAALKPGGRLVAEEMDFRAVAPDPRMGDAATRLFARVADAHNTVLAGRFDAFYGRRVCGDLLDAGLTGVRGHGRAAMWRGGEAGGRIWWHSIRQLREPIVAAGLLADAEIDRALALFDAEHFSSLSPVVMAATGAREG
jgi:SAM-dependent methyltransferase